MSLSGQHRTISCTRRLGSSGARCISPVCFHSSASMVPAQWYQTTRRILAEGAIHRHALNHGRVPDITAPRRGSAHQATTCALYIDEMVNRARLREDGLMASHPLLAALPNPWVCDHLVPGIAFQRGTHRQGFGESVSIGERSTHATAGVPRTTDAE